MLNLAGINFEFFIKHFAKWILDNKYLMYFIYYYYHHHYYYYYYYYWFLLSNQIIIMINLLLLLLLLLLLQNFYCTNILEINRAQWRTWRTMQSSSTNDQMEWKLRKDKRV